MKRIVKNIIVAALFVACVGSAMAQSRFYHLAGDTVRGKSPIYYYSWWPEQNFEGKVTDSVVSCMLGTSTFMRQYTPDTIKVIGIASTLSYVNTSNWNNPFEECDTSIDAPMFYTLYNATPNGPVELARACWTCDYNDHPKRYIALPMTSSVGSGATLCEKENLRPSVKYSSLREYYFDSAITVVDSFYLGWEYNYRPIGADDPNAEQITVYCMYHNAQKTSLSWSENVPCRLISPQLYMYHDLTSSETSSNWSYRTLNEYLLVFPIIEIDTMALMPCATPATPTVTFHDNARARVEWVDYDNYEWTVAVAAAGRSPESGRMYSAAMTYIDLTGLNADSAYSVYVKGHCHGEIWSDWSLPCRIDALPNEGIEKPGTVRFSLSPNPAVSTVTVTAAAQQGTVTVIDMQGREMISCSLKGTETVLDIKALAAGTYIVKLDTPQGNSTQKLTVE